MAVAAMAASAHPKFTPSTASFLDAMQADPDAQRTVLLRNTARPSHHRLIKSVGGVQYVDMFVELNDEAAIADIEQLGGFVGTRLGNLATVTLPVDQIENLADYASIKKISVARLLRLKNDKARAAIGQDNIHDGKVSKTVFTGKGVIYGFCDSGVDFKHLAFQDADGNHRFAYAYLPSATSGGSQPTGTVYDEDGNVEEGGQLPGREYTRAQVNNLTSDYKNESHGSHTTGIGAGSYKDNDYYGMAPDADIIACASEDLSDVNIVNGVAYVFDKAEELGQPAVVNLSLGINTGPHDGTGYVAYFLNELAKEGRLVVVASGNEGDLDLHIGKTFTSDTDELKSFFCQDDSYTNLKSAYTGYTNDFDVWGRKEGVPFTVKLVIYDRTSKEIVQTLGELDPSVDNQLVISNNTYLNGRITLYGNEQLGKYEVYGAIGADLRTSTHRLGIIVTSSKGNTVDVWTDAYGLEFENDSQTGWVDGTSSMSINDFAIGDKVISVGAYNSRTTAPRATGGTINYSSYGTVGRLADFSSYGPDANGVNRPDIVAPGMFLVSALNGYDTNYGNSGSYRTDVAVTVSENSHNHRWGAMMGTSMACPVVAGVLATWLEPLPDLSPEEVKEAFANTAIKDAYVKDATKWGDNGKLSADEGLRYLMRKSSIPGAVNSKRDIMIQSRGRGVVSVMIPDLAGTATVEVYNLAGSRVASFARTDMSFDLDLADALQAGIYVLQVKAGNKHASQRVIIK